MPDFSRKHFDTEGPLGIPMKDAQAKMLESILQSLPQEDRCIKRFTTAKAPTELLDGERADVSWISTEEIDRDQEIVVARGMNDSQFRLNPIVTLQHCYGMPPVGKSLWRKRAKDGALVGIKAKTQYPQKPDDWPGDYWGPDEIFTLIKNGLMNGKSIGFLRLKSHPPSSHEIAAAPELAGVGRIIDEWLLLEYACVFLPANQNALVEQVSKGLSVPPGMARMLNLDLAMLAGKQDTSHQPLFVAHTSEEEIHRSIKRQIDQIDWEELARNAIDRARGRV
jgi:hypothetical protein